MFTEVNWFSNFLHYLIVPLDFLEVNSFSRSLPCLISLLGKIILNIFTSHISHKVKNFSRILPQLYKSSLLIASLFWKFSTSVYIRFILQSSSKSDFEGHRVWMIRPIRFVSVSFGIENDKPSTLLKVLNVLNFILLFA